MKSSKLFLKNNAFFILPMLLIVGSILPVLVFYRGFEIFWILGVSLAMFTALLTKKIGAIKLTLLDITIVLFTLYIIIHYIVFANFSFFQITFWVFLSYPLCYYILLGFISKQNSPEKKFIPFGVILLIAVIESVVGLLQYFDIYPSPNTLHPVLGTFYSPNALSLFLSVALLICIWRLCYFRSEKKITRYGYVVMILLFSLFIIGLKARSSWYAIIFGLVALWLLDTKKLQFLKKTSKKRLIIIGLSLVTIFSIASYYAYQLKRDSANSRLFITKTALCEAMKKPVFGHGVFSFKGKYNLAKSNYFNEGNRDWSEVKNGGYTYHAFNEWVYLIFEIGIVGLLLFIWILVFLFRGFQITDHSKIGLTILIMLFVFSMVSYPIYIPHIAFLGIFGAAIIRSEGNYSAIYTNHKWFSKVLRAMSLVIGAILLFITTSKIRTRLDLIKYYNNPHQELFKDKQKVIKLFKSADDIGESKFYLGDELYKRGDHAKGLQYMKEGFFELLEPKMGAQLAAYLTQENKHEEAEKIYKINIGNEPFRFKPKMDYIWFLGSQGRYAEQNEVLKRIIDLPIKIPSQEAENYKKQAKEILKGNQKIGF